MKKMWSVGLSICLLSLLVGCGWFGGEKSTTLSGQLNPDAPLPEALQAFSPDEMEQAIQYLPRNSYSRQEIANIIAEKDDGLSVLTVHYSLGSLIHAGYDPVTLKKHGFTLRNFRKVLGLSFLKKLGYVAEELNAYGFSHTELENAAFSVESAQATDDCIGRIPFRLVSTDASMQCEARAVYNGGEWSTFLPWHTEVAMQSGVRCDYVRHADMIQEKIHDAIAAKNFGVPIIAPFSVYHNASSDTTIDFPDGQLVVEVPEIISAEYCRHIQ